LRPVCAFTEWCGGKDDKWVGEYVDGDGPEEDDHEEEEGMWWKKGEKYTAEDESTSTVVDLLDEQWFYRVGGIHKESRETMLIAADTVTLSDATFVLGPDGIFCVDWDKREELPFEHFPTDDPDHRVRSWQVQNVGNLQKKGAPVRTWVAKFQGDEKVMMEPKHLYALECSADRETSARPSWIMNMATLPEGCGERMHHRQRFGAMVLRYRLDDHGRRVDPLWEVTHTCKGWAARGQGDCWRFQTLLNIFLRSKNQLGGSHSLIMMSVASISASTVHSRGGQVSSVWHVH